MPARTTRVTLAYGERGLDVDLPADRTTVVEPRYEPALADPSAAVRAALRAPLAGAPLRELVRPGQSVAISICDITRPQPRRIVVPALLDELAGLAGDVTVLVATGTHRGQSDDELSAMLGADTLARVRVVVHDARDAASLVALGATSTGVPIELNRRWVEADVRITTGFVEPHFFAGFSGGPKLVAPGLAGLETTLALHDAARIGHPKATWGVTEGNPVHDDVREIARLTGVHMALDVTLDAAKRITGVYAGELFAAHAAACARVARTALQPVEGPFDVVLTSNAGYPLDQNLYQAVKGLSAAARVVRDGGTIVCAAECRDGLPDHGSYGELLFAHRTPAELLRAVASAPRTVPDEWQVQIQAKVLERARVLLRSEALAPDVVRRAHLEPIDDVGAAVRDALARSGPEARVCVLPHGPETIPTLA